MSSKSQGKTEAAVGRLRVYIKESNTSLHAVDRVQPTPAVKEIYHHKKLPKNKGCQTPISFSELNHQLTIAQLVEDKQDLLENYLKSSNMIYDELELLRNAIQENEKIFQDFGLSTVQKLNEQKVEMKEEEKLVKQFAENYKMLLQDLSNLEINFLNLKEKEKDSDNQKLLVLSLAEDMKQRIIELTQKDNENVMLLRRELEISQNKTGELKRELQNKNIVIESQKAEIRENEVIIEANKASLQQMEKELTEIKASCDSKNEKFLNNQENLATELVNLKKRANDDKKEMQEMIIKLYQTLGRQFESTSTTETRTKEFEEIKNYIRENQLFLQAFLSSLKGESSSKPMETDDFKSIQNLLKDEVTRLHKGSFTKECEERKELHRKVDSMTKGLQKLLQQHRKEFHNISNITENLQKEVRSCNNIYRNNSNKYESQEEQLKKIKIQLQEIITKHEEQELQVHHVMELLESLPSQMTHLFKYELDNEEKEISNEKAKNGQQMYLTPKDLVYDQLFSNIEVTDGVNLAKLYIS